MGCHKETLPIQCEQKKAPKKIPNESDFIASNIAGFGDDIGSVTNRITTQTDIQAGFSEGEREYEELEYRVISGQFIQQNCIDYSWSLYAERRIEHVVNPDIWGVRFAG